MPSPVKSAAWGNQLHGGCRDDGLQNSEECFVPQGWRLGRNFKNTVQALIEGMQLFQKVQSQHGTIDKSKPSISTISTTQRHIRRIQSPQDQNTAGRQGHRQEETETSQPTAATCCPIRA